MNEVKTADLSGPALDWAVAVVEGVLQSEDWAKAGVERVVQYWDEEDEEMEISLAVRKRDGRLYFWTEDYSFGYLPTEYWEQGGPLIEKYITALNRSGDGTWWSHCGDHVGFGPTQLIATCRAIVAAKLGDTVQVPENLSNTPT